MHARYAAQSVQGKRESETRQLAPGMEQHLFVAPSENVAIVKEFISQKAEPVILKDSWDESGACFGLGVGDTKPGCGKSARAARAFQENDLKKI